MLLVDLLERVRPNTLFHGTDLDGAIQILLSNRLEARTMHRWMENTWGRHANKD